MNQAQLIGNITADPEIRTTPNGHKVASFSVATNRRYKDNAGVLQEKVEYHNIIAWSKLAEIIEKYCTKGKKVFIQGRMETRSWDDAQGVKRYKTEVICEVMEMLGGGKPKTSEHDQGDFPSDDQVPPEAKKPAPKKTPGKDEEISIEDIPF